MTTVQNMVPPKDLAKLLGPRNDANQSGFQRAHIIGRAFIRDNMPRFADLIGGADNDLEFRGHCVIELVTLQLSTGSQ